MSALKSGKEYELKYWIRCDLLPQDVLEAAKHIQIVQGYIAFKPDVRVRITNGEAVLEIKGRDNDEFGPMQLKLDEARTLLRKYGLGIKIRKDRFVIASAFPGLKWELDFFKGANAPLAVAEIETPTKSTKLDRKKFPVFIGEAITGDPVFGSRMGNRKLAREPFSTWPKRLRAQALRRMGLRPR